MATEAAIRVWIAENLAAFVPEQFSDAAVLLESFPAGLRHAWADSDLETRLRRLRLLCISRGFLVPPEPEELPRPAAAGAAGEALGAAGRAVRGDALDDVTEDEWFNILRLVRVPTDIERRLHDAESRAGAQESKSLVLTKILAPQKQGSLRAVAAILAVQAACAQGALGLQIPERLLLPPPAALVGAPAVQDAPQIAVVEALGYALTPIFLSEGAEVLAKMLQEYKKKRDHLDVHQRYALEATGEVTSKSWLWHYLNEEWDKTAKVDDHAARQNPPSLMQLLRSRNAFGGPRIGWDTVKARLGCLSLASQFSPQVEGYKLQYMEALQNHLTDVYDTQVAKGANAKLGERYANQLAALKSAAGPLPKKRKWQQQGSVAYGGSMAQASQAASGTVSASAAASASGPPRAAGASPCLSCHGPKDRAEFPLCATCHKARRAASATATPAHSGSGMSGGRGKGAANGVAKT